MLAQQFLERELGEDGAEAFTQLFVAVVAAYEGMTEDGLLVCGAPPPSPPPAPWLGQPSGF